jgi:hypothetical protein
MTTCGDINSSLGNTLNAANSISGKLDTLINKINGLESRLNSIEQSILGFNSMFDSITLLISELQGNLLNAINNLINGLRDTIINTTNNIASIINKILSLLELLIGGGGNNKDCLTLDQLLSELNRLSNKIDNTKNEVINNNNTNKEELRQVISVYSELELAKIDSISEWSYETLTIVRRLELDGGKCEELIKDLKASLLLAIANIKLDLFPIEKLIGELELKLTLEINKINYNPELIIQAILQSKYEIITQILSINIDDSLTDVKQLIIQSKNEIINTVNLNPVLNLILQVKGELIAEIDKISFEGVIEIINNTRTDILSAVNTINFVNEKNEIINTITNGDSTINNNLSTINNNLTTIINNTKDLDVSGIIVCSTGTQFAYNSIPTMVSAISYFVNCELNVPVNGTIVCQDGTEFNYEGTTINTSKSVVEALAGYVDCSSDGKSDCISVVKDYKDVYPYDYHFVIDWYDTDNIKSRYPNTIVAGIDATLPYPELWDTKLKGISFTKGNVHAFMPLLNYSTSVISGNYSDYSEAVNLFSKFVEFLAPQTKDNLMYDDNNNPIRYGQGASRRQIKNRVVKIQRLLVVNTTTNEVLYCFKNKVK